MMSCRHHMEASIMALQAKTMQATVGAGRAPPTEQAALN